MVKPSVCAVLFAGAAMFHPSFSHAQSPSPTGPAPAGPAPTSPAPSTQSSGSVPLMDHDQPIHCVPDTDGTVWRVQCDDSTKICLYAQNRELDSRGKPIKALERARRCAPSVDMTRESLRARGFILQPGRVDAPHGWTRDDRGRVFQVNFDLKRRLYLGAAYAPALKRHVSGVEETRATSRTTIDFGLFIFEQWGGYDDPTRHRIRLVEGEIAVAPFSADLTLIHYDVSRRFPRPLLRLTTFFGKPRRHDITVNVGFWLEGMKLESHQNEVADVNLWKFGSAQGTIDLWQSPRLDSYLRIRSGLGIERLYSDTTGDRGALTWESAAELDWVVDESGFHNLKALVSYERPRYFESQEDVGRLTRRVKAEASYEAVILAINDQPLTARFSAKAERRDDIPGLEDRWGITAGAGLRFSLWAPPRRK